MIEKLYMCFQCYMCIRQGSTAVGSGLVKRNSTADVAAKIERTTSCGCEYAIIYETQESQTLGGFIFILKLINLTGKAVVALGGLEKRLPSPVLIDVLNILVFSSALINNTRPHVIFNVF